MGLSPKYRLDWPTHDWDLIVQAERETPDHLEVFTNRTIAIPIEQFINGGQVE